MPTDNDKLQTILNKYENIIKEEVNVKQVSTIGPELSVEKIIKPIGSKLSIKFGKDTGKIIQNGKQGNIEEMDDGKVKIYDEQGNQWILDSDDYEIAYQGLDSNDIAIQGDTIAKLDLNITPELAKEGIAREISRFLNQMRKEVDYSVDDKVKMFYFSDNKYFSDIIEEYGEFLKQEVLLTDIEKSDTKVEGDIVSLFELDGQNIEFSLQK